jgi:hypothetical protein
LVTGIVGIAVIEFAGNRGSAADFLANSGLRFPRI